MRAVDGITDRLNAQRGHLFGWVPVCLAIGIGGYFGLSEEPGLAFWIWGGLATACLFALSRALPYAFAPLILGVALVVMGAGLAKFRVEAQSAPVLTFRYYGPIAGRVVNIDRSASDAVRLTLDQVVLDRMAPDRTPERVRVSLHGDQPLKQYLPGDRLITTGHLSPPSGPAEPGGFDFQRHAWFAQLGAVGYTRNPALRAAPADESWGLWIFASRIALSRAVQAAVPGEPGAFAAAIMTGDRSGMGQATLTNLRASNLAHLLAISGLHMGLLTGFVFALVRYSGALIPRVALCWPLKKIAAAIAITAGAGYLALSGGNVATERAFIMIAVMFMAVLLDRRALTLRAVAMAATVVLIWQPEALTGPGFQMSFAATTALVVVFRWMRNLPMQLWPGWLRGALQVFVSSFVAGLATAPIAAAHFNQIAHFGLIANLLSVPLMGALVMPAAVLAICLAPFGLWGIGLWFMEWGLRWILYVAATVAAQEGALSHVVAPGPWVVPVLVTGFLWLILWQGWQRWSGLAAAAVSFVLWAQASRPALLVADNGALIGMMTNQGRVLSRAKGSGFVAGIWLENDGAPVPQDLAAARDGLIILEGRVNAELGGWRVLQVNGKVALANLQGCDGADVMVSNQLDAGPRPCPTFDLRQLRQTGALAMDLSQEGALRITTARDVTGTRPWNAHAAPPDGTPPLMSLLQIDQ